jgi:hypothetical protein
MDRTTHFEELQGRIRGLLITVAEQLPISTIEFVDEMVDANERGLAVETMSEMLVESDATIDLTVLMTFEQLYDECDSTQLTSTDSMPLFGTMNPLAVRGSFQPLPVLDVRIVGNAEEFLALAELIAAIEPTSLAGSRPVVSSDELRNLVVLEAPIERLEISLDEQRRVLQMRGERRHFGLVAENLRDLAQEGTPGDHWHLEFVPGHYFLAEGSRPVVFELVAALPVESQVEGDEIFRDDPRPHAEVE